MLRTPLGIVMLVVTANPLILVGMVNGPTGPPGTDQPVTVRLTPSLFVVYLNWACIEVGICKSSKPTRNVAGNNFPEIEWDSVNTGFTLAKLE